MMNRNSIAEKILCLYFNLEMQKKCLPLLSKALYPTAGGTDGILQKHAGHHHRACPLHHPFLGSN